MVDMLVLGDLVPERFPVKINRVVEKFIGPDDQPITRTEPKVLWAYRYGPRCPVTVKAVLSQIRQRLSNEWADPEVSRDTAFQIYARDSILALVEGISFEEADMIAADDDVTGNGLAIKTLRYLNYWVETASSEEVPPDPEVPTANQVEK